MQQTNMTTRLKLRIRELGILHGIARAVTSILDLQSVLNRIVEAAVYLTNAEEGFIMLIDEESNQLHLRAGKGLGDKAAKVMRIPVQDSLAGQVIETGKPLKMGGRLETDSYKVKTGYLVKSILNVPIKGQNRILGVLSVDHAMESLKTFSDHDVNLLTNLAEYAAIAIENARRYEDATRRAEELAQTLEEYDVAPEVPTRETDREALEKFNVGLRSQRQDVAQIQEWIAKLAQDLQEKSKHVDTIVQRLGAWNEEVENLLPQLDWIAQTALVQKGTGPLDDTRTTDNESIALLKTILAHLPVGILMCNAKGKILEANTKASNLLNQGNLVERTLTSIAPSDTRWEHLVGSLRLALALGHRKKPAPPPSATTLYINQKTIKATLVPTSINKDRSVAIVVLLRDVSLESEGWRAREKSLLTLSERLRTPMATISSYTDLLLNESVGLITRGQNHYLQRIREAVNRIEDSLINVAHQSGYIPLAEDVPQKDLVGVLRETVSAIKKQLALNNVTLAATIPSSLPAIRIPPQYFAKILTDLLLQAGMHTQPREVIEVSVSTEQNINQPTYVVVAVSNRSPHTNGENQLEEDIDLKTIARAVEYQGGRMWTDIDYKGRWIISFLVPTLI